MINKKTKFTTAFLARLIYMFRGDGHSHKLTKKVNGKEVVSVRHLGGNTYSPSPLIKDKNGDITVDVEQINKELEKQAGLYKGTGSMFCAHYILSLPAGEEMNDGKWLAAATMYMEKMGYGSDTKWVAAIHNETDNQHVHIVACRVKDNGTLVKDNDDYKRGYEATREVELKFGLTIVANPEESFGIDSDTTPNIKNKDKDHAFIIRRRFDEMYKNEKPETMTDLVKSLGKRDVLVNVVTDNNNPTGIKFSIDGNNWLSGSSIKKTRTTWPALLKTIDYNPSRDNIALGIATQEQIKAFENKQNQAKEHELTSLVSSSARSIGSKMNIINSPVELDCGPFATKKDVLFVHAFVRTTSFQIKKMGIIGSKHKSYSTGSAGLGNCMTRIICRLLMSSKQKKMEHDGRIAYELAMLILTAIFGSENVDGVYTEEAADNRIEGTKAWKPIYEYEHPDILTIDMTNTDNAIEQLSIDAAWRCRKPLSEMAIKKLVDKFNKDLELVIE